MPDVTKFAGYRSPLSLVTDPALSQAEKLGGLATWHVLLAGEPDGKGDAAVRGRLLDEIDRALDRLTAGKG